MQWPEIFRGIQEVGKRKWRGERSRSRSGRNALAFSQNEPLGCSTFPLEFGEITRSVLRDMCVFLGFLLLCYALVVALLHGSIQHHALYATL